MSERQDIRAVIFDTDGVLTDSEPLINAAAIAMLCPSGVNLSEKGLGKRNRQRNCSRSSPTGRRY